MPVRQETNARFLVQVSIKSQNERKSKWKLLWAEKSAKWRSRYACMYVYIYITYVFIIYSFYCSNCILYCSCLPSSSNNFRIKFLVGAWALRHKQIWKSTGIMQAPGSFGVSCRRVCSSPQNIQFTQIEWSPKSPDRILNCWCVWWEFIGFSCLIFHANYYIPSGKRLHNYEKTHHFVAG